MPKPGKPRNLSTDYLNPPAGSISHQPLRRPLGDEALLTGGGAGIDEEQENDHVPSDKR